MTRFPVAFFAAVIIAFFLAPANAAASKTVVVFGDSLVAGYNLPLEEAYPAVLETRLVEEGFDVQVVNAGVSGDTTSGGLTRLEWTLDDQQPDFVILELGANDMLRRVDQKITQENLDTMLQMMKDRNIPVMIIGIQSFTNFGVDYFDSYIKMYKSLAKKYKAVLYPFFLEGVYGQSHLMLADGLHPNTEGVKVMVENTLPGVKKLLEGKTK